MIPAQHRSTPSPPATVTTQRDLKGAAPRGMWWVAWRQHRLQVVVALGLMALLAASMIVFRIVLIARMTAAGCSLTEVGVPCDQRLGAGDLWSNTFNTPSAFFHLAIMVLPVVVGVFVAAPSFPREFGQGTHVLALTQSIGRLRWWAVKVTVVSVPVIAGLLALGLLMQWVDGAYWATASQPAMSATNFGARSMIPAAYGMVSIAIALAAGIALRRVVATLVVGLLVAGVVVSALTAAVRPNLLPTSRATDPVVTEADIDANGGIAAVYRAGMGPDDLQVNSGYLTSDGRELSYRDVVCQPTRWDESATDAENMRTAQLGMARCFHDAGVVSYYTDYLPGTLLWTLRWTMTGICSALAALFLALGAWRLPRAVAKR